MNRSLLIGVLIFGLNAVHASADARASSQQDTGTQDTGTQETGTQDTGGGVDGVPAEATEPRMTQPAEEQQAPPPAGASTPSEPDGSQAADQNLETGSAGDASAETASAETAPGGNAERQPGSLQSDPSPSELDAQTSSPEMRDERPESSPSNALQDEINAADLREESSVRQPAALPGASTLTTTWLNLRTHILLGVVLVTLAIASIVARYLRRQPTDAVNPALVRRFRQRLNAWWLMCAILVFGLLLKSYGTVLLFWLVSFWALREFITMAPTRRGDHRALFWALIVFTPLQYLMIGLERIGFTWWNGRPIDFYGLYSIFIPVYASLFIPARIAISGDHKRFLERSAQITAGLLICVYALSYAPALINLKLTDSLGNPWNGSRAGLLFYLVLVSQLADILHWTWGHLVGRRVIAPDISASRTWEGFAGGTLSTGLIGGSLFWVTPFTFWEAMGMSMIIAVMGMFGGMTMSAIKRDRGVNDYGSLVLGHAGVLDRIDTLCFAAPVFYHLTRFFFT